MLTADQPLLSVSICNTVFGAAGWTLTIGVGTVGIAILVSPATGSYCAFVPLRRAAGAIPLTPFDTNK
jgi:hypothetical protein